MKDFAENVWAMLSHKALFFPLKSDFNLWDKGHENSGCRRPYAFVYVTLARVHWHSCIAKHYCVTWSTFHTMHQSEPIFFFRIYRHWNYLHCSFQSALENPEHPHAHQALLESLLGQFLVQSISRRLDQELTEMSLKRHQQLHLFEKWRVYWSSLWYPVAGYNTQE